MAQPLAIANETLRNWGRYLASDRRLKTDYGKVAETRGGIGLHLYRYKWEDERDPLRLGVMADELEKVIPSAVVTHRSGIKMVDYAQVR